MGSMGLATNSATTCDTRTPSFSNSTDHTSPIISHQAGPYEDSRNKMNISSLLDAAAQIDDCKGKRKIDDVEGTRASSSSPRNNKRHQIEDAYLSSRAELDNKTCESWDQVEYNFTEHVAGFLDMLLGTKRFTRMNIVGKARASGLPLDGVGTVSIPGNGSGANTLSRSTRSMSHSDGGDDRVASGSINNTVIIGQNIATLEAIRQMLCILCPGYHLNNLSIDEGSVGKLEELRISNDFRLLRAVVQLIQSPKETDILSVWERDSELLLRIQALHNFIRGSAARSQQQKRGSTSSNGSASSVHSHNGRLDALLMPAQPAIPRRETQEDARAMEKQQQLGRDVLDIFETGLEHANNDDLWKILTYIGNGAQLRERTEERTLLRPQLSPQHEEQFLEFVNRGGVCEQKKKVGETNSSDQSNDEGNEGGNADIQIALLMGAHYYLVMREPLQQSGMELRESSFRLQLLESCATTRANNVVARRLVNMMLG